MTESYILNWTHKCIMIDWYLFRDVVYGYLHVFEVFQTRERQRAIRSTALSNSRKVIAVERKNHSVRSPHPCHLSCNRLDLNEVVSWARIFYITKWHIIDVDVLHCTISVTSVTPGSIDIVELLICHLYIGCWVLLPVENFTGLIPQNTDTVSALVFLLGSVNVCQKHQICGIVNFELIQFFILVLYKWAELHTVRVCQIEDMR